MMDEIWLPIKGYEGSYEVSNLGRVRSLDRVIQRTNGSNLTMRGKQILPLPDAYGYHYVGLSRPRERKLSVKIHRLVAIAFVPNPENKPEVNHIDAVKTNNVASNLEWTTRSENMAHANLMGLVVHLIGEKHGMAKLTPENIYQIKALRRLGHTYKEIGVKFDIPAAHVGRIVRGEAWKHLL